MRTLLSVKIDAITDRHRSKRDFILHDNLWSVIILIGLPLVFYNGLSQVFSFIDTLIAASMGPRIVSIISFISQIQLLFTTLSAGIGLGGGILIGRAIGEHNTEKEYRLIVTLSMMIGLLILLTVGLAIPLAPWILWFFKMPADLFEPGLIMFRIELSGLVFVFLNSLYFAIQRARGYTGKIFSWNLLILSLKLTITLFLVYVLDIGPISLSVASFIAQGLVALLAVGIFFVHEGASFKTIIQKHKTGFTECKEIIHLSLPVFLEKFIFNYGKAVVNGMSAIYGSMAIGALGVSNRIGGLVTMPPIGFQEAEATIISQNLGNKNYRRAFDTFKVTCMINIVLGIFFFIAMSIFKNDLIQLFSKGDPLFSQEIAKVYNYERYASILLAISSSVMGLLYGFGYTRLSMLLNLLRLFVFRIPPLWYFQHFTNMKTEGLGIAMMISNMMMGISAIVGALFIIQRWRKGLIRTSHNKK
ncbi:MATE family efflux transporter [Gracilinema caldarium]|uniref:Multi antimicrobial extrusion protein MatE n=1 Tax=Gracilinema caldarium (strain ATCC 51460 / DSM 7334 / H1) TaxID=744872 RepID=F8F4B2_GRAC1|nr:MATE family efflux transporter [Gracilinema caldarium]AEJ20559.1 multi antimicrobial extrusion protein MatE [Gracilinema caldarium DSM 7334]